jgi:hypothetical protein
VAKEDRDEGREDELPWARPAFMVAAAFLVVVLGLGAWLVTKGHPNANASRPGPTSAPTSHIPPTTATPSSSSRSRPAPTVQRHACHLSDTSQQVPDVAPAGITWSLWNGVALPSSQSAGPGQIHGAVARCYAHTPLGALLASVQISYRLVVGPEWKAVAEQQLVPGPGRTHLIQLVTKAERTAGSSQPGGTYSQVAAFNFVTYTPAVAVIDVVFRTDSGSMAETPITVQWSGGDWKLLLPGSGTGPPPQPVSSIVGYVMWQGV